MKWVAIADRFSRLALRSAVVMAGMAIMPAIATAPMPPQLVLAKLNRQATGGGWFNLSLEGYPQDVENALNYLRDLEIEIFDRTSA